MSKIFPFKPRKIKEPKADPDIDRLFEEAKEQREREKAERDERHQIMAELYAEDLARRAERLRQARQAIPVIGPTAPPPPEPELVCCPDCQMPLSKYAEAIVRQKLKIKAPPA